MTPTPRLRLSQAEVAELRNAARERYWNATHTDTNVGYARWQAEIDAIEVLANVEGEA